MDWWTDPRMLAAGNVRGIPGGDPDFPVTDIAGAVEGSSHDRLLWRPPDFTKLSGDLDAHAERLGIPVEDLVAARRREPGPIARLFSAMGRWAR